MVVEGGGGDGEAEGGAVLLVCGGGDVDGDEMVAVVLVKEEGGAGIAVGGVAVVEEKVLLGSEAEQAAALVAGEDVGLVLGVAGGGHRAAFGGEAGQAGSVQWAGGEKAESGAEVGFQDQDRPVLRLFRPARSGIVGPGRREPGDAGVSHGVAAPISGDEVERGGRQPAPGAAVPQAMLGGEHLAGADQGSGAESSELVVDAADGAPGIAIGLDRRAIIGALNPGQPDALVAGRHGFRHDHGQYGGAEPSEEPHRSRRLSSWYSCKGASRYSIRRRLPVLISTVTAMPGVRFTCLSPAGMVVLAISMRAG